MVIRIIFTKFVKLIIKTRYMKTVINDVLENLAKRRPLLQTKPVRDDKGNSVTLKYLLVEV